MSSVLFEGAVYPFGEVPFRCSDGFGLGFAFGHASSNVDASFSVESDLGQDRCLERGVDGTVPEPVQTVMFLSS